MLKHHKAAAVEEEQEAKAAPITATFHLVMSADGAQVWRELSDGRRTMIAASATMEGALLQATRAGLQLRVALQYVEAPAAV